MKYEEEKRERNNERSGMKYSYLDGSFVSACPRICKILRPCSPKLNHEENCRRQELSF
jgi:hypothetical protein